MRFFFLAFLFFLLPQKVQASVSMSAAKCEIMGKVLEENTRKEEGRGMSQGEIFTYYDTTIRVLNLGFTKPEDQEIHNGQEYPFSCVTEIPSTHTYQKIDTFMTDLIGKCIKGKTHFLADGNFRSGNWLSEIELLEDRFCNE